MVRIIFKIRTFQQFFKENAKVENNGFALWRDFCEQSKINIIR